MRKIVISLIVAVLVLGAGAGVGEWFARRHVVGQIVTAVEGATGTTPNVTLDSFPLLLDLARGSIAGVDGSAENLEFEGLVAEGVSVQASEFGIRDPKAIGALSGTADSASIEQLSLTAITFSGTEIELDPLTLAGLEIAAEGLIFDGVELEGVSLHASNLVTEPQISADVVLAGQLSSAALAELVRQQMGDDAAVAIADGLVTVGTTILGQELSIGLTPSAVDGGLTLMPEQVTLGGLDMAIEDLPFGLGAQIQPIPVEVPLGPLQIDSVEVVSDGVRAELSGTGVTAADFATE